MSKLKTSLTSPEGSNDTINRLKAEISQIDTDSKFSTKENVLEAMEILQDALIDLYLNVKVWTKDEIKNFKQGDLEAERENLYQTSPMDLINYIQTSVEILMNLKVEDYLNSENFKKRMKGEQQDLTSLLNSAWSSQKHQGAVTRRSASVESKPPEIYEEMIQKLEADVRNHIKVE